MTHKEILEKAIGKVWDNGYRDELNSSKNGLVYGLTKDHDRPDLYSIIFSHDFAKAFWGEEEVDYSDGLTEKEYKQAILDLPEDRRSGIRKWGITGKQIRWQYHLQQMVLEENPIKYLEKFL